MTRIERAKRVSERMKKRGGEVGSPNWPAEAACILQAMVSFCDQDTRRATVGPCASIWCDAGCGVRSAPSQTLTQIDILRLAGIGHLSGYRFGHWFDYTWSFSILLLQGRRMTLPLLAIRGDTVRVTIFLTLPLGKGLG